MPNRRNFLKSKYSVEIGYPLLAYGCILELEQHMTPAFRVLEFGSRGSTIFFSRRCGFVKSFENRPEWADKVRAALSAPSNVELILCDTKEGLEIVAKEPDEYYDIVLADSDPDYRDRLAYANAAIPKLRKSGFMVIDNYEHRHLKSFDYSKWDVYTYDGIRHSGRGTKICVKR